MAEIGLVLQGGGARGAYQIGVWRAMNEFCITPHISGVSGASVGALNGALFAIGDYEKARNIWENISPEQVFRKNFRLIGNVINFLDKIEAVPKTAEDDASVNTPLYIVPVVESLIKNLTAPEENPDANGLHDLILNNVDFNALRSFRGNVYAMCTPLNIIDLLKDGPKAFDLTKKSNSEILNILMASSALPFIFENVDIDGTRYIDGGIKYLGNNVPVKPLYDDGIRRFIVIYISDEKLRKKEMIDPEDYSDAEITSIIPGKNTEKLLEKPTSLLRFEKDYAKALIECGYCDAVSQLEPMCELGYSTENYFPVLKECRADEDKFFRKHIMNALPDDTASIILNYLRQI